MKTNEELNELRKEAEALNQNLPELTADELKEVSGGKGPTSKIAGSVKLLLPAGKATAAPPVGPALNPYGINIPAFLNEFNARTKQLEGLQITTIITINADHSFTFKTKTPPIPVHIKPEPGL